MDRNAYKPGETANISLEMNNGSKAAIHHVSVQLLRRLRLGTRGNGWGFYKTDLLNSVDLPGLQPGESRMDFAGRTLAFPLVSVPGPDGEPPVSLQAEVKGDIIECEYVIVSVGFVLVWIGRAGLVYRWGEGGWSTTTTTTTNGGHNALAQSLTKHNTINTKHKQTQEVVAKVDWTPTIGVEIPVHIYHTAAAPPPGFVHAELPTAQAVSVTTDDVGCWVGLGLGLCM